MTIVISARCHGCEDVFCSFAKKKDEGDGDANGGVFFIDDGDDVDEEWTDSDCAGDDDDGDDDADADDNGGDDDDIRMALPCCRRQ